VSEICIHDYSLRMGSDTLPFIIKDKVVEATVWHVLVANARLLLVTRPCSLLALAHYQLTVVIRTMSECRGLNEPYVCLP
jgi:hypothetical protein